MKEQKRHNKKGLYAIIISVVLLILIFFVILPQIIVGPKSFPDTNETRNRFSEFFFQPEGLQGIEARTKEGYALLKYNSKSKDSFEQIELQAVAKGWIKTDTEKSGLAFTRENQIGSKMVIFQYEIARVSRSQIPDLICVGYDRFLSTET